MDRIDIDPYMMGLALMAKSRATCSRRAVGCVLTNHHNHVIATGYNGTPTGMPHCSNEMCPGRGAASGTFLDGCMATHAEQNALLQCTDKYDIHTVYCTTQPCFNCTKVLLNTSAKRIVYLDPYPHKIAEDMWRSVGRELVQLSAAEQVQLKELFRVQSDALRCALTASQAG